MAKAHKNGLGKGLADLFAEEQQSQEKAENSITTLPMTMIEPNKNQPRKVFDAEKLLELTKSIEMHGVITPITVRKQDNGYYQIIAGERRWRAARDAGLTEIPAMVLAVSDAEVMELALIENLQRQDLNPIEEAEGYETLLQQFGMTQDKVAERVGKSRSAVANALRLLALDTDTRRMVSEGQLSSGHARAVLSIKNEQQRADAARQMAAMSVRQAESYAKKLNKQMFHVEQLPAQQVDYVGELERKLESQLGRKVRIDYGKTRGMVSLEYYGDEDLERLTEALATVANM